MAKIFISYSRSDQFALDKILSLVRDAGYESVWFDGNLTAGTKWWSTIESEIDQCELFIFLISNESLKSKMCRKEVQRAVDKGKFILPVIVRRLDVPYPGNTTSKLKATLKDLQYVTLEANDNRASELALLKSINRYFSETKKLLEPVLPASENNSKSEHPNLEGANTSGNSPSPPSRDKHTEGSRGEQFLVVINIGLILFLILFPGGYFATYHGSFVQGFGPFLGVAWSFIVAIVIALWVRRYQDESKIRKHFFDALLDVLSLRVTSMGVCIAITVAILFIALEPSKASCNDQLWKGWRRTCQTQPTATPEATQPATATAESTSSTPEITSTVDNNTPTPVTTSSDDPTSTTAPNTTLSALPLNQTVRIIMFRNSVTIILPGSTDVNDWTIGEIDNRFDKPERSLVSDSNILTTLGGMTPQQGFCLTYLRAGSEEDFTRPSPCDGLQNDLVGMLSGDIFWRDFESGSNLDVELRGVSRIGFCQWTADDVADCIIN